MSEVTNSPIDRLPIEDLNPLKTTSAHDNSATLDQLEDMRLFNDLFRHMSEDLSSSSGITTANGEADLRTMWRVHTSDPNEADYNKTYYRHESSKHR